MRNPCEMGSLPTFAAFGHRKNWVVALSVRFLQVAQFSLRAHRVFGIRPWWMYCGSDTWNFCGRIFCLFSVAGVSPCALCMSRLPHTTYQMFLNWCKYCVSLLVMLSDASDVRSRQNRAFT